MKISTISTVRLLCALAAALPLLSPPADAQMAGEIDLTFEPAEMNAPVRALVRQSDGGWVIGGEFTTIDGEARGRIARLKPNGALDEHFGAGLDGAAVTPDDSLQPSVNSVVIQSDGKILVGGSFTLFHGEPRNYVARLNPDGTLDPTFGADAEGADFPVFAIALQSDGKVIVAGGFPETGDTSRRNIVRLHPDGRVDESFEASIQGSPTHGIPGGWGVAALAIQPDGKIIVGGGFSRVGDYVRHHIVRLNQDGSIDPGFSPLVSPNGRIETIALQEDGKILVGGRFTQISSQPRNRVARLHRDGSLDASFGDEHSGVSGSQETRVQAIAVQPTGRIVIGGEFVAVNGETRVRIAQLRPDGSLDEEFAENADGANGTVLQIVLQEDLQIVIAGRFSKVNDIPARGVARLHSGNRAPTDISLSQAVFTDNRRIGSPLATMVAADPDEGDFHTFALVPGEGDDGNDAFAVDGALLRSTTILDHEERASYTIRVRATDAGGLSVERVLDLNIVAQSIPPPAPGALDETFVPPTNNRPVLATAHLPDGKILIGGDFSLVDGKDIRGLARLNPDGSLDSSFANGENLMTGAFWVVRTIALQDDGKILIGGSFSGVQHTNRAFIARLHPDGSFDPSFDPGLGWPRGEVLSILSLADGKILIGGAFSTASGYPRNRIARLNHNGTVDESFGAEQEGADHTVETISLQEDGKILIGGLFSHVNGIPRSRLARLHPDGTVDMEFGHGLAGANGSVRAIAPHSDGRVLIGGHFFQVNNVERRGMAMLFADGSLDPSFHGEFNGLMNLSWLKDGRILGVGVTHNGMARFHADGQLDTSFSKGISGANQPVYSVVPLPEDRILIGGAFTTFHGEARERVVIVHGGIAPPSAVLVSNTSIAADASAGSLIGELSAMDPDDRTTHEFSLVAGEGSDDNSLFIIEGNQLKLSPHFEGSGRSQFSIRVRATNESGIFAKAVFTLTSDGDPYGSWAAALPEGERGPTDDPGGHGIPNLLRYAFGMDALAPDRTKLPGVSETVRTVDGQEQRFLTLTYTRRTDDDSLTYVVEGTDDLGQWREAHGQHTVMAVDDGTETVQFRENDPLGDSGKRFLRVRVERW